MVRRLLAVVALAIMVVACGGEDAESSPPTGNTVDTTVAETGSKPTTSAATKTTTSATAAPKTTAAAGNGFSFSAIYVGPDVDEFAWEWIGSFSIEGDNLVGSGTVSGISDGMCGIEGGTRYPVSYTATGEFDIAGTADDAVIALVLRPTDSNLDLAVGDLTQLCVELSADMGQAMLDLPLGDAEVAILPIEVPRSGGTTTLDFDNGFVIEVEIAAL